MAEPVMWQTYRYLGHRVRVIQQWADPFGRKMVRIESADDGGEHATGLFEDEFMQTALPDPDGAH